ncbi:hypothetical protein MNBD_CPR01-309 [hydrothermal vent metagenome]|uniref:SpoVT-AbrB domain-containing protein n=1 Tax=hydrothermal vent metagenome TaxID=652676 RepID=A0A3B0UQ60_9ZZZZ
MATIQKLIKVGSSVAVVIPKSLLGKCSAGAPISIEKDARTNTFLVRVLPEKKNTLSAREKHVLSLTDSFVKRYRTDLKRLKDA